MGKLKITKVNLPSSMYKYKCPYKMSYEYVTVHNTWNNASAMNEVSYMQRNKNQVSFHFAVDDTRAVQGLPLDRNAWHAGDGNGTGNRKTIGVEICYSKSGGADFDKAEKNAAYLCAVLLHRKGYGISRLKKHQDWSGKYCPHRTLDRGWSRFKTMVEKERKALEKKKPSLPSKPSTGGSIKVGDKVKYSGYLYKDSNGNGRGSKVSGTYKVTRTASGAYGYHLADLGWAKKSACSKVSGGSTAKPSASYYPKCSSKCDTITEGLNSIKVDSSYSHRAKIAKANGIKGYEGTASQNIKMLELLKKGKLKKA